MTRLVRTALLAVLLFLASTELAHAECAWVLWARGRATQELWQSQRSVVAGWLSVWHPQSGYKTKSECEAAARKTEAIKQDLLSQHGVEDPGMVLFARCLPDTVDPRDATK